MRVVPSPVPASVSAVAAKVLPKPVARQVNARIGHFLAVLASLCVMLALVLAVPLVEASMKLRSGEPVDEPSDVEAGTWAGVIPLRRVASDPVSASDSHDDVPPDVVRRAGELARGPLG